MWLCEQFQKLLGAHEKPGPDSMQQRLLRHRHRHRGSVSG